MATQSKAIKKDAVLSIDTDYITQMFLRKKLKHNNYVPFLATNCIQGLKFLETEKQIKVVVLDLKYPTKEWVTFLKQLKFTPLASPFTVYITNCKSEEAFFQKLETNQIDKNLIGGFLEVPLDIELTIKKITGCLRGDDATTV